MGTFADVFLTILRGVSIQKWGKNRLGEVAKEAFSSGVETTFPCEQITIGVTSFGELLYQRRSQRRPKQKRDLYSTECILESQKTNRPRREAPRRNVMESKHTEAAPALGAADRCKPQAKQFQNSVLLRSFHNRQNFCLPRVCIDVRSMREKKKMKSYLVECLSTTSTLKKTVQKKSLKKNR